MCDSVIMIFGEFVRSKNGGMMEESKRNLNIIVAIILVVAIVGVIYVMNKPKEIAYIEYDIKITHKYNYINVPTGGWASTNEYVLFNINDKMAYFIEEYTIYGDSTGKYNGTTISVLNEEKISGNTFEMIMGLTERNSDYNEKSFSNYYEIEYKGKTIKLTDTPLLDSIFNSIKE